MTAKPWWQGHDSFQVGHFLFAQIVLRNGNIRFDDFSIWGVPPGRQAHMLFSCVRPLYNEFRRCMPVDGKDGELMPEATIKKYLTVQSEGGRQVSRNLDHYNLQMIIAGTAKCILFCTV